MSNKSNEKVFVFYSDKLNYSTSETKSGKNYFVEGHIATGDLDLVNDIVTKGCMDDMTEQFNDRVIKLDFEHEAFRGKSQTEAEINKTRMPLGKACDRTRDSKGVKVKWQLNPTWKKFDEKGNVTMTFKDIWSNIEDGYYDAFSIAYIPTKTANSSVDGKEVRLLDRVNLMNVALTGNPINQSAKMTAVMAKSLEYLNSKNKDGENMEEIKELKDQIDTLKEEMKSKETEITDLKTKVKEAEAKNPEGKGESDESGAGESEGSEGEGKKPEGKSAEETAMLEVKSELKALKDDAEKKDKEIKELKDVVEKARHKSRGAENKGENNDTDLEIKGIGALDMI